MRFRHLDYGPDTGIADLGPAAIDDLLERGDFNVWSPIARAVHADPTGPVAETVLRLCEAHPMYGTSALWRAWIERLRRPPAREALRLAEVRATFGLTQQAVADRMGISQSDVSKLERRKDLRLSTLRAYLAALGARLDMDVRAED